MSLNFDNRTLGVQIDGESATISGGFGVYPLTLWLRLAPMGGFERGTVIELAAELELQEAPARWLAASTRPARVALYGSPVSVALAFPLTSAQILGIEERRSGGKPTFTLKVHGVIVGDPADVGHDSEESFVIASSTWLDLTEQVSAAVAFTIPIPVAITPGAHAEGAELLKEARRHLNAGNIDAAIVSARKAMDRAEAAALWPAIARNDDLRSRSQAQRWRAIHKAAFDQASGAAHEDEVTKEFAYTRREAEALIGIAAALLKAAPGPLA
jgi:hypothetical protein